MVIKHKINKFLVDANILRHLKFNYFVAMIKIINIRFFFYY